MNRRTTAERAIASCFAMLLFAACGDDDVMGGPDGGPPDGGGTTLPTAPPTEFESVAAGSFQAPTDAVASPDGTTFYFAAFDMTEDALPAIYSVPADGSAEPTVLYAGDLLSYPSGLVLDCEGETLYVADSIADPTSDGSRGAIYSIALSPVGAPMALDIGSLVEPNALAVNAACTELYVSGRTDSGQPAVVHLPLAGGAPTVLLEGEPLVAPTGIYVDVDDVAWVLDYLAEGDSGGGVLYSIDPDGTAAVVVSGVEMGAPGGVSLTAGGGTAVIGARDRAGDSVLTAIAIASAEVTTVALPSSFLSPAGLRTARRAGVFVFVDSEGSAIYRGQ